MTGRNKRSVERDYNFYNPPEVVKKQIETPGGYMRGSGRLETRDRALFSLEYIATARAVEITGGPTKGGDMPGVTADQFFKTDKFLYLRGLKNVKKKFIRVSSAAAEEPPQANETYEEKMRRRGWVELTDWRQYPNRIEIPIPREGGLSWIAHNIEDQLEAVGPRAQLFNISPIRAHQIINKKTGLFNHYFKAMGIKLWYILLDGNAFRLKEFTGHKRWESLEPYMRDINRAKSNMLNWSSG